MLKLDIQKKSSEVLHVLFLGAHCDDIEIGCGGTVLSLADRYKNTIIHWVVFASNSLRKLEATASANSFLSSVTQKQILVNNFRESYFPYIGAEIKDYFERIKEDFSPDLVFTHYRYDRHQDHRLISDLTWNTFRDHLILEYEVPKFDGDIGNPNVFVPLTQVQCNQKIDLLHEHFTSQRGKSWFERDTFLAMLRIRGMECNASEGLAEAFYCRKLSI